MATPHFQGSDDEADYQRALYERELFRAKHSRSANPDLRSPAISKREKFEHQRREAAGLVILLLLYLQPLTPRMVEHLLPISWATLAVSRTTGSGKKEQAARDLEERRKSLAKRGQDLRSHTPACSRLHLPV